MEERTTGERTAWIDIAKVLGLVIVLMNHAALFAGGINFFGGMFYVPVFFVLAGYTFRLRPQEGFSVFAKKKAKRLLLPYVGYNGFLFLFFFIKDQLLGGQPMKEAGVSLLGILYSRSYFYAGDTAGQTVLMRNLNGPTWFLTGLFTALLSFRLLLRLTKGSRKKLLAGMGVCLCAAWAFSFLPVLLPWSLDTLWFHLVLMGAGYLMREWNVVENCYRGPWKMGILGLLFLLMSALSGSGNLSVRAYGSHICLYLAAALLGSLLAMLLAKWIENTFRQAGHFLAFAGSHTMAVLCLHLFVFMLIAGGYGALGIDGSRNLWKVCQIVAAFVLLVPFYRFRPLSCDRRDWQKTACGLLLLVLVLWSWPLAGKGIDVRDTGSYLTKYRYLFDSSVKVNELHYFLGELAGGIVYALTPVRKVLALNVASSLVYTAAALLVARVLERYLPRVLALACALTGTFFSITWIRTLNWNAWTALLLSAGLWVLLQGLQENSQKKLGLAGFLLAINTYFRMPNMLFLALLAVVCWKSLLESWQAHQEAGTRPRPADFGKALLAGRGFFLGAVAGAVVGLLLALLFLGPDTVLHNLAVLTSVGAGENAENTHSITTGIYLFLLGMKDGAVWWIGMGLLLFLLWLCLAALRFFCCNGRKKADGKENAHRMARWLAVGSGIACGIGLAAGIREDVLTAHTWVAFGVIFAGILGTLFYAGKDTLLSCLCAAAVIIEGLLTIGTDTGVNYYRVYMALPLGVLLLLLFRAEQAEKEKQRAFSLDGFFRMLAVFSFVFVTTAGLRYAATHVYHDAPNEQLTATIDSPLYTDIYTSPERARSLNRLMEVLAPYEDQKLLQIGCFNIGCVLTDMKPFYDSSWPDLEYLPMQEFEGQLQHALAEGQAPVLLLGTAEESGMNWSPSRYALIRQLGESSDYRTLYVDPLYTIYVPVEE